MAGITKPKGMALIDCAMIVFEPDDTTIAPIAITSGTKLGVEQQTKVNDAVELVIKGESIAKKPEQTTVTGHKLTLTDNLVIIDLIQILQGGNLTKDETSKKITGYTPPVSGKSEGKPGTLKAYSAIMEGSTIAGYSCIAYPHCIGVPVCMGAEDNVFQVNEYTINSTPGSGQAPYAMTIVDALPTVTAA
jgi:hypothetical protein